MESDVWIILKSTIFACSSTVGEHFKWQKHAAFLRRGPPTPTHNKYKCSFPSLNGFINTKEHFASNLIRGSELGDERQQKGKVEKEQ